MAARDALLEALKISCFVRGIHIEPEAGDALSAGGTIPLSVHEYATTGGITFELVDGVYVNAPFDEWWCSKPEAVFGGDNNRWFVRFRGEEFPVRRVLPLPGYLGAADAEGRSVEAVAMSHGDRVRLSPIVGCAFDCAFCDLPAERYRRRPLDHLEAALKIAANDDLLPARHVLISGGSPGPAHYDYFEEVCRGIAHATPLPVDIMMSPRVGDEAFFDRVVSEGIDGFSLNMELFSEVIERGAPRHLRGKARITAEWFGPSIERAVNATGGDGRVRSLLIIGLEPLEMSLRGVEFLAQRGCEPVLSPFRPARDTKLVNEAPPPAELLAEVLDRSRAIVDRYGVKLGPRCLPCQHNTLTYPADVGASVS